MATTLTVLLPLHICVPPITPPPTLVARKVATTGGPAHQELCMGLAHEIRARNYGLRLFYPSGRLICGDVGAPLRGTHMTIFDS